MLDDSALERMSSDTQELSSLDDGTGFLESPNAKEALGITEIKVFEVDRHEATIREIGDLWKTQRPWRELFSLSMTPMIFFDVTVTRSWWQEFRDENSAPMGRCMSVEVGS